MRDLELVRFDEPMQRLYNQGMILGPDGEKMSKSRGNVVNPDEFVDKYGADTVRGYLMFIGPWNLGGPWNTEAIEGVVRFLYRAWTVVIDEPNADNVAAEPSAGELRDLERKLHQTIIKVTDDITDFRFNTAISALMELNNAMIKAKETAVVGTPLWDEAIRALTLMMAPIFPHIAEEMWQRLHGYAGESDQMVTDSVHVQAWPEGDAEKAKEDEITVVVQVNGKVRDKLAVEPGTAQDVLEEQALSLENVQKWINGKQVRKVIVVPNKLVNVVVG